MSAGILQNKVTKDMVPLERAGAEDDIVSQHAQINSKYAVTLSIS